MNCGFVSWGQHRVPCAMTGLLPGKAQTAATSTGAATLRMFLADAIAQRTTGFQELGRVVGREMTVLRGSFNTPPTAAIRPSAMSFLLQACIVTVQVRTGDPCTRTGQAGTSRLAITLAPGTFLSRRCHQAAAKPRTVKSRTAICYNAAMIARPAQAAGSCGAVIGAVISRIPAAAYLLKGFDSSA